VIVRRPDGTPEGTLSLDFDGDRIRAIRSQVNPEKLRHLTGRDDSPVPSGRAGAG
jgi:hypothetical protein